MDQLDPITIENDTKISLYVYGVATALAAGTILGFVLRNANRGQRMVYICLGLVFLIGLIWFPTEYFRSWQSNRPNPKENATDNGSEPLSSPPTAQLGEDVSIRI